MCVINFAIFLDMFCDARILLYRKRTNEGFRLWYTARHVNMHVMQTYRQWNLLEHVVQGLA